MSPPCILSTKKLKVAYVLYLIRDRYGIVTVFQRLELDVNVWILLWNRHRHSKGQEGNKLSYPLKLHLNFNDTSQLETLLNERLLTIGTGRKCLTVLCECGAWWPGGEGMGSWCNRCNRPAGDCLGKTGVVNWRFGLIMQQTRLDIISEHTLATLHCHTVQMLEWASMCNGLVAFRLVVKTFSTADAERLRLIKMVLRLTSD